ncbi:hypothetical protein G7Y89_g13050 [Cudoniella acicularis]|uniref:Uncharacterized protein n=1 Tax=Cudoniella acicularis TaxID=354080 RepID=A0A8H4R7Z2_9HELO|nr:hypothetical protein G7Y89_g13050 [Cudoniella acicularis]
MALNERFSDDEFDFNHFSDEEEGFALSDDEAAATTATEAVSSAAVAPAPAPAPAPVPAIQFLLFPELAKELHCRSPLRVLYMPPFPDFLRILHASSDARKHCMAVVVETTKLKQCWKRSRSRGENAGTEPRGRLPNSLPNDSKLPAGSPFTEFCAVHPDPEGWMPFVINDTEDSTPEAATMYVSPTTDTCKLIFPENDIPYPCFHLRPEYYPLKQYYKNPSLEYIMHGIYKEFPNKNA